MFAVLRTIRSGNEKEPVRKVFTGVILLLFITSQLSGLLAPFSVSALEPQPQETLVRYRPGHGMSAATSNSQSLGWSHTENALHAELDGVAGIADFTQHNAAVLVREFPEAVIGSEQPNESGSSVANGALPIISDQGSGNISSVGDDVKESKPAVDNSASSTPSVTEEAIPSENTEVSQDANVTSKVQSMPPTEEVTPVQMHALAGDIETVELGAITSTAGPETSLDATTTVAVTPVLPDDDHSSASTTEIQGTPDYVIFPFELSGFSKEVDMVVPSRQPSEVKLYASMAALQNPGASVVFEYRLNEQQAWQGLAAISLQYEISNDLHNGYFTFELPESILEHLDTAAVRVLYKAPQETSGVGSSPAMLLDGVWIESHYANPETQDQDEIANDQNDSEFIDPDTFLHMDLASDTVMLQVPGNSSDPITLGGKRQAASDRFQMLLLGQKQSVPAERSGNHVQYRNVYSNTDVDYAITPTGLKESITLQQSEHPKRFRYSVRAAAYDSVQIDERTIGFYERGHGGDDLYKRFTVSAPVMVDHNGQESRNITMALRNGILTVTPDPVWLKSAAYPVIVDPSVDISVLNVHSHPIEGDVWNVDFMTVGTSDLTISPADEATVSDMQFQSLFCGSDDRTSQVKLLPSGVLYYPEWECDDIASVKHLDLRTGDHHFIFSFGEAAADAYNAAYKWDGGGVDANWTTAANWSSNIVPTSADSVTIDNTCATNCNPVINASTTVASMTISSATTTVTQSNGSIFTVSGAFTQSAGTFTGGNGTTTFGSSFTQSGGTFTSASTTRFTSSDVIWDVPTSATFYDVIIDLTSISRSSNMGSGDTWTVMNNLILNGGGICVGTLNVRGNITQNTNASACSATLNFANDSAAQTYTLNGGSGPKLNLDSAADANDTVVINAASSLYGLVASSTFVGTVPLSNAGNYALTIGSGGFTQAAGTFQGGPWTLNMSGPMTRTAGTFIAPTTTNFTVSDVTHTFTATTTFENLGINYTNQRNDTISGAAIITGTLTFTAGSLSGGTLYARGNVVVTSTMNATPSNTVVVWDNDALSQTWTTSGLGAPGLRYDSPGDANDAFIINGTSSLYGLNLTSGFSGTIPITNAGNYALTIGSGGFTQAAGTFQGGPWTLNMSGPMTRTAGTFIAPTTTNFTVSDVTHTFTATTTFENLGVNVQIGNQRNDTLSGAAIVNGTLTFTAGSLFGGTLYARGNVVVASTMNTIPGSTMVVWDNDALSQTWTTSGVGAPGLSYDSIGDANDSIVINGTSSLYSLNLAAGFNGTLSLNNPGGYGITFGSGGFAGVGGFTQAAGTFIGGPGTITQGGSFIKTGGTYIAASSTIFTASDVTHDVDSPVTFENLTFNDGNGRGIVIASGDSFISTRTLTLTDGALNTGTLNAQGNVVVASTFDGGNSPLLFSGTADQTFSLSGATSLFDGDVTINKPSGTVTLLSSMFLNAAGQDLQIASGSLDLNGNNIAATGTSSMLVVGNGGTLKLIGSEIISATSSYPSLALGSTVEYYGTSTSYIVKPYMYGNLTISGSGGTFTPASSTLPVLGTFTHLAGVFNAPSTMNVYGDFIHSGGTFNHSNGAVNLLGSNQMLDGNTTFYNLTKSSSTSATLTVAAGSTQVVANTLTLAGALGQSLSLRSSVPGSQWYIDPQGTRLVTYLDVKDSNNINAAVINATGGTNVNSGNNTHWDFGNTFTQNEYRFYENINNLQPTVAVGGISATTTIIGTTSPVRLRINLTVGSVALATSSQSFVLQYATSTSGTWTSVGTGQAWQFYNNGSMATATTIGAVLLPASTVVGLYSESNPTGANPATVGVGQNMEWDFALDPSGAVLGSTYYFRMVTDNATAFQGYAQYAVAVMDSMPNPPSSFGPSSAVSGDWFASGTPTMTFTLSDNDALDTVGYNIQISTSSNFSSLVVDYTSVLAAQGARTFTVGQSANGGNYTIGSVGQGLPDASEYYWRVKAFDVAGAMSNYATATSGVAFKVDSTAPSAGTITATSTTATQVTVVVTGASDMLSGLSLTPYLVSNLTSGNSAGATSSSTSTFTGLSPNISYTFVTRISDVAGNNATTASVTLYTLASSPSWLSITSASANSITLTWSQNGNPIGTTYMVQNMTTASLATTTSTTTILSGLSCGQDYMFRVKALNNEGVETAYTPAITGSTHTCSVAPPQVSNGGIGFGGQPPINNSTPPGLGTSTPPGLQVPPQIGPGKNSTTSTDLTAMLTGSLDKRHWYSVLNVPATSVPVSLRIALPTDRAKKVLKVMVDCTDDGVPERTVNMGSAISSVVVKNVCKYAEPGRYKASAHIWSNREIANVSMSIIVGNVFPVIITPSVPVSSTTSPTSTLVSSMDNTTTTSSMVTDGSGTTEYPSTSSVSTSPGGQGNSEQHGGTEIIGQVEGAVEIAATAIGSGVMYVVEGSVGVGHAVIAQAHDFFERASGPEGYVAHKLLAIQEYVPEMLQELPWVRNNEQFSVDAIARVHAVLIAPAALVANYSIAQEGIVALQAVHIADMWLSLIGIVNSLLSQVGLRRRRRYWGTVYDSETKQPLDPAIVELVSVSSGKVVEQCITNLEGKFGFLDNPGEYVLRVRKSNYIFPSRLITDMTDGMFANVYHGEKVELRPEQLLVPNIPMDAVRPDWNQSAKLAVVKYHPRLEQCILVLTQLIFYAGFIFSLVLGVIHPTSFNLSFVLLYAVMFAVHRLISHPRLWGVVLHAGLPIDGVYIEASPQALPAVVVGKAIAKHGGKFFMRLSKGSYIIRVKRISGANAIELGSMVVDVDASGVLNRVINIHDA